MNDLFILKFFGWCFLWFGCLYVSLYTDAFKIVIGIIAIIYGAITLEFARDKELVVDG